MKKFLTIVILNIAFFIILFFLCEVLIRMLCPTYMIYKRTYPGQNKNPINSLALFKQKDKDLGWVLNTEKPAGATNNDFQINRQGFRDRNNFDETLSGPGKTRIMVLGDSFVFGAYVGKEDALPPMIQKELGGQYQTFNLGVPGWGIDQMYLAYKKYSPVLKPHIVILVYISQDVERVFEANRFGNGEKPSFEIKNNKLLLRDQKGPGILERYAEKSYFLNMLYSRLYRRLCCRDITEHLFLELAEAAKDNNQIFAVVKYPTIDETYAAGNSLKFYLKEHLFGLQYFCKRNNILFIDLNDEIKALPTDKKEALYFDSLQDINRHPTPKGYEYTAKIVIKNILKGQSE